MTLAEFLRRLAAEFRQREIPFCVLRNYHSLPHLNDGTDLDLLVPEQTTRDVLVEILNAIPGAVITGQSRRDYVLSVFVSGVASQPSQNAIQVDFVNRLSWKGLAYLQVSDVLAHRQALSHDCAWLSVPSPRHEALVSFFSSYLVGGWIQDRYQPRVRCWFSEHREDVIGDLSQVIPADVAVRLVDAAIDDDRDELDAVLPRLRRGLLVTAVGRHPWRSVERIRSHYAAELRIRFGARRRFAVGFLGPDGAGKTTIIRQLTETLGGAAKDIEVAHLRPHWGNDDDGTAVDNPHGAEPRTAAVSVVKLLYFVLLYQVENRFRPTRVFTVRFWDRYYHDILIDPKRYRFGASPAVARFFTRFIPSPQLWIVLDAEPDVLYSRKRELPVSEATRLSAAYRRFASEHENAVLIDTTAPLPHVVEQARRAVITSMARAALAG
jgi:thymidylate kinase